MDLSSALNVKTNEIERPKLIPTGIYAMRVKGQPKQEKLGKGYESLDFNMQLLAPREGVDEEALAAYGGLGSTAVVRHRFMFGGDDQASFDRTMFNLKQFLTVHLGIEDTGQSLKELIMESPNRECLGLIRWRPDKTDPDIQYVEIGKTTPLE